MDHTVHGIFQARILEWVAFPFSRESSQTRDRTQVSCIAGGFFTSWAIREALISGKPFLEMETNMDFELPYGPIFPAIASGERHNTQPPSMDLTKHLLLHDSYFPKIQLLSLLYFFICFWLCWVSVAARGLSLAVQVYFLFLNHLLTLDFSFFLI